MADMTSIALFCCLALVFNRAAADPLTDCINGICGDKVNVQKCVDQFGEREKEMLRQMKYNPDTIISDFCNKKPDERIAMMIEQYKKMMELKTSNPTFEPPDCAKNISALCGPKPGK